MSVDQSLHHLNAALEMTLGRLPAKPKPIPILKSLFKLYRSESAMAERRANAPELLAGEPYDFEAERIT
jgi:hypothetical protein